MRRRKTAIAAAAVAVAAAGTLLAGAGSAQALPGHCTIAHPTATTYASMCPVGTGHHRIHMVLHALEPILPDRIVLGPWAAVGQQSVATNPWGPQYIASMWVDTVDW